MASAFGLETNDELWRECAQWFTSWEMISSDHKVNMPDAKISDFANILRDGVLLCKLLNKIDPGCIDMKSVNLKPTMAQCLCLRNITTFLLTSQNCFALKQSELFDAEMLFFLTNFHKVLCTLSKLSLHVKSQQGSRKGFYVQKECSDEQEEIYQRLQAEDMPTRSQSITDDFEDIYQEIVIHPHIRRKREVQQFTFEKRDYVINELLETEKNYADVLTKLKRNFMAPLKNVMKPEDHRIVFLKIDELHSIHTDFYREISQIRNTVNGDPKLANIFMDFRNKFLVYGDYCANLQRATTLLQDLCDNNDDLNKAVLAYEKEVNDGRFKLRDVLSVPMQRILKYHLLLEKLIENTNNNHEEYIPLQRARETMLDVAGYINEAARDSDCITVINNVQKLITDWQSTREMCLLDYGKLLKDCDLKMSYHNDPRNKHRYVFIFQKCILICKPMSKGSYSFRDILKLQDYVVETRNRSILRETRFMPSFILVKSDKSNAVTFYLRSDDLKDQIVKKIEEAVNDLNPEKRLGYHTMELMTFKEPTTCHYCSKFLKGLIFQGYKCTLCNNVFHKICKGTSVCAGVPTQNRGPTLPPNNIELRGDPLRDKLWFVGKMDRGVAESKLRNRDNGTYLVRIRPNSEGNDKYALSLKTNTIKHMRIQCKLDSGDPIKYFLSQNKFFNSVEELIINYQQYSLKENFDKLDDNTKLEWSYRQQLAIAIRHFEKNSDMELSLVQGTSVYIIGKEGYKEGWWKGYNDSREVGFFPKDDVKIEREVLFD